MIQDLENWAEGDQRLRGNAPGSRATADTSRSPTRSRASRSSARSSATAAARKCRTRTSSPHLEKAHGETAKAKKVFRDLREVNDPEAPTTGKTAFPYDLEPTGPTPGALRRRTGLGEPGAAPRQAVAKASHRNASNFLLVGHPNTKAGHPLAVMGPQLGYFYPEIVMQGEIHAPASTPRGSSRRSRPYVFIGRGKRLRVDA